MQSNVVLTDNVPTYTAFFKAKLESQPTVVKDFLDQSIQRTCLLVRSKCLGLLVKILVRKLVCVCVPLPSAGGII